jgi:glycosyltransferase involved in cell wall biosynthesis
VILFLYLRAFSVTGGIEKVNRVVLKALHTLHRTGQGPTVCAVSAYDEPETDPRYFPTQTLHAYRGQRWRLMLDMLWRSWGAVDTLLVGHINLAPAVWLLHLRYPRMRMVVLTHGIEVWRPLSPLRRWLLRRADLVLAVSHFTRNQLVERQGVRADRVQVLPNCLDPYFEVPTDLTKPAHLLERYGLRSDQKVLLTITRLSSHELYKGYDQVLASLPALLQQWPDLQYLIGGKADAAEHQRLSDLIERLGLQQHVRLLGFIPDAELTDHYRLADAFVMPSKKEGFGLVFIEAMACGTLAIGGNLDGSIEALRPGELGWAINPDRVEEVTTAIREVLSTSHDPQQLQANTLRHFSYEQYLHRLKTLLQST